MADEIPSEEALAAALADKFRHPLDSYDDARAHLAAGRVEHAIEDFEKAAKVPRFLMGLKDAGFYNDWASAVERTKHPEQAFALYDKALQLEADNGHAWFKKAQLHERLGAREDALRDYAGAATAFQAFVARVPTGGTYPHHLYTEWGRALLALGRLDEAEQRLREALRIRGDHQEAKDALAELEKQRNTLQITPTLVSTLQELGDRKVSALEVVRSVVRRHTEFSAGRAQGLLTGADLTAQPEETAKTWIEVARRAYPRGLLDGRRLLVGLALSIDPLRELMTAAAVLSALSTELLANVLQLGLERRCAVGLARGGRLLTRPSDTRVFGETPLLVLRAPLPTGGLPEALKNLQDFLRSHAVTPPTDPAAAELFALINVGRPLMTERFPELCARAAKAEGERLLQVIDDTLQGHEQIVLVLDAAASQLASLEQLRLELLPGELFESGAQRLVIVVSGAARTLQLGHARVSFELLVQQHNLLLDELLDFCFYLFVFDAAVDARLLEELSPARFLEAYSQLFTTAPVAADVRTHLQNWRHKYPAPDALWKSWTLMQRQSELQTLGWNIDS